ncbi:MAG: DUF2141 domain-containing protein, partial [Melioribacteraceae bacterium]|nr:DUF2141 domain-containing protein [Melioribacteraceae bacterium]
DSLAFGEYAIKCYHDVNENRELDTNFFGIPSEDYGFSNNAPATFGPPSFEQAAFKFKSHNQIEKIELQ